ncbi:MAG: hypothetical protein ACOX19_12940 [Fermentimonas sp.]
MGSIDEGTPLDVTSHIAIEPWITADVVDGTMDEAHYLVVKELKPIMANDSTREIDYISSLPVDIAINEAYYEYYDMRGDYFKVVFTADGKKITYNKDGGVVVTDTGFVAYDGSTVTASANYLQNGKLMVGHAIPINYEPFYIKFTVSQQGGPLTQEVFVTQYPPIYITGRESIGFRPTEGDIAAGRPYADFRYHSSLGVMSTYQGEGTQSAQRNNVFNRITSKVPTGAFLIGNPVDANGLTKSDAASNNVVSPEFIIATQYGMSYSIPQKAGGTPGPVGANFGTGYGPYARNLYPSHYIYREVGPNPPGYWQNGYYYYYDNQYKNYGNAEGRCYNYFEGEYGTDGSYYEYYQNTNNQWTYRTVYKTFKYQGRWRIPTLAEAKLIDQIQDDANTLTKGLMYGENYWTAKDGTAYDFKNNQEKPSSTSSFVRCIFDTAHLDDK